MAGQLPLIGDLGEVAARLASRVRASVVEVRPGNGGAGAGVVWRSDGTIVTNHHVATRDAAEVTLADGRSVRGEVVARDPRNDLAALKIHAERVSPANIGDARQLRVGELVLAIGHPFGIRGAVTIGVVNAISSPGQRTFGRELIRADVVLGPGNSGGPLVDAHGRVVGINAMVAGGLALAVPSHLVERLLRTLTTRPRLGVGVRDVELTPALAATASGRGRAVVIVSVAPGSPAERAGVLVGDVLFSVGGQRIAGADDLVDALAASSHGPVRLGLLRGGVPREVVVDGDPTARWAA